MFALDAIEAALARAARADLLYFSLITLAILPAAGRRRLLDLASFARAHDGKVAFDGNYRPLLWPSETEARDARDAAIAVADIGLPTLADEVALGGPTDALGLTAEWGRVGCTEKIVLDHRAAYCRRASAPARRAHAVRANHIGPGLQATWQSS